MQLSPEAAHEKVNDYTIHLKRKVKAGQLSSNTLPTMVFGVKAFFEANDIDLRWRKIARYFPESEKRTGRGKWTDEQIKQMLKKRNRIDSRATALIHFLAASRVRIGAVPDMKINT